MIRKAGIVSAWVLATVLSTVIAANAVGSVRGQVTDIPAIAATTTTIVPSDVTASSPGLTTSTLVAGAGTSGPTTPTTTSAGVTSSTVPGSTQAPGVSTTAGPVTSTTSAAPPSTSTTTTSAPGKAKTLTYQLEGGQVTISAAEPNVSLISAVPNAGYAAEIDEDGPDEVKVEFESNNRKSTFKTRWVGGMLDVDISTEDEGSDD